MRIHLKYFGVIAEELGRNEEVREFEEGISLDKIADWLAQFSDTVKNRNYRIAVNQTITTNEAIADQDELAFLPPYSGG